jgi:predicted dehydrogenase
MSQTLLLGEYFCFERRIYVDKVNIALIGTKFMGRAHSQAWNTAPKFFKLGLKPVMKVVCDLDLDATQEFADTWGWQEVEVNWRKVVERDDVDIIDICAPNVLHQEIAIAAAKNGKHIFCEKPIALSYAGAQEMVAAVEKTGVLHYINHNYRRVPAVAFAKKLIDEGKIGQIYHWRGAYLQDWTMDPNFPLTWQLRKELAGGGPHYDLNSHSVDLARYLIGDVREVTAMMKRFVEKRPLPGPNSGTFKAGSVGTDMGQVTVEDALFMLAEFDNGALGSFETSRMANGRKNYNSFEIYGSEGSLSFDMERMNELQYLDGTDPADIQGFRTILVTDASHPYVGAWWPPGHIIGYEHTISHAVADFVTALAENTPIAPNFYDGMKEMQILEAGILSAETGRKVMVSEIK